eukprot:CAMPEP_0195028568 /NCGR_PEP_ID=MMETSP0326_2-20130528/54762_1 /TAXON_ID=2866 ORGANISM="Crypthecodinium cohnii, Strain Seligo" /NCGR_SAMPLE_ID=MMETSP0326_2 /ASSEMBLY_ACC=CAM_ASM_000348 /LENGTH=48 /DNA_ID= /DNA_START= /DNA_END= /DNA_ORIENTATION=
MKLRLQNLKVGVSLCCHFRELVILEKEKQEVKLQGWMDSDCLVRAVVR